MADVDSLGILQFHGRLSLSFKLFNLDFTHKFQSQGTWPGAEDPPSVRSMITMEAN